MSYFVLGRNRRCIDKNFGSIFILWDKLFGTFEPEGKESITYGITKPLQSFGPVTVQVNKCTFYYEFQFFFSFLKLRN